MHSSAVVDWKLCTSILLIRPQLLDIVLKDATISKQSMFPKKQLQLIKQLNLTMNITFKEWTKRRVSVR